MNISFRPYDSADYLKTEADIADYLQAIAEENCDDPAFKSHVMDVVTRARSKMKPNTTEHTK